MNNVIVGQVRAGEPNPGFRFNRGNRLRCRLSAYLICSANVVGLVNYQSMIRRFFL